MTIDEALAVLKKDEEEERLWRSARSKLTEVLTTAKAAEATGRAFTQQKQDEQAEIARLIGEKGRHQQSVTQLEQRIMTVKERLHEAEAPLLARIHELKEEITVLERQKTALRTDLDQLRLKHAIA